MVEADVATDSALVGASVAAAPFPRDTVLVSIERDDDIIVPRGDVVIEGGDRLSLFATQATRESLLALLSARGEESSSGTDEARTSAP